MKRFSRCQVIAQAGRLALQREDAVLGELAPLQQKSRELESELEGERERLAKLYKVYEDLEAEKKDLARRIKAWEEWFHRLQPALQQMCSAAGGPAGT